MASRTYCREGWLNHRRAWPVTAKANRIFPVYHGYPISIKDTWATNAQPHRLFSCDWRIWPCRARFIPHTRPNSGKHPRPSRRMISLLWASNKPAWSVTIRTQGHRFNHIRLPGRPGQECLQPAVSGTEAHYMCCHLYVLFIPYIAPRQGARFLIGKDAGADKPQARQSPPSVFSRLRSRTISRSICCRRSR